MPLVYSALLPHPEALLNPGGSEAKKLAQTAKAFETVAKDLLASRVDTVIIITAGPLGPIDPYSPPVAQPNMYAFYGIDKVSTGPIPQASVETKVFDNDLELMRDIQTRARPLGISLSEVPHIKMDPPTSTAALLLHLDKLNEQNENFMLGVIHLPYEKPEVLAEFGSLLAAVAKASSKKIALCGIGNSSSRLTKDSPAGFKPEGKQYDDQILEAVKKNDFSDFLKIEPNVLEAAGEENSRPLSVLVGANRDLTKTELVSYEAPLGIGYAAISWKPSK